MPKCKECGLMHPYVAEGQCLVAKARKLEGTEKGKSIAAFITKLSVFLEDSEDWRDIITKINNLLKM